MNRLKIFCLFAFISIILVSNFSVVAQNGLDKKLMMGYQGWFLCEGDGSPPNDWRHWFTSTKYPSVSNLGIDFWPDMSEYTETYSTNMTFEDGSTAKLFSSYDSSTTMLHFKWLENYNIHGVYLQRFLSEAVNDPRFFKVRNHVLENVMAASSEHNRHFAIMYDLSGVPDDGKLEDKLINDWEYLVDTYDILNQEEYVKQDGKPVIGIWGIGFRDRGLNPATFSSIIDYFHNTADPKYQAYILGGVPSGWRTLSDDSEIDEEWSSIYLSLDMISPWTVGRYSDQREINDWRYNKIEPDIVECQQNGVDYMPVIWPGFSWKNIHDGPLNQIPRNGGKFYWRQAYNAIDAGAEYIYVAMFDEVDEGTAMFKLAADESEIPIGARNSLVTLDADGYELPNDWYLQLADETQKMLDKTIPLTEDIPLPLDSLRTTVDQKKTKSARIFPNPASDKLNIELENSPDSEVLIEIVNLYGSTVRFIHKIKGDQSLQFDVSGMNTGVYLLKVYQGSSSFTHKFMIE